MPDYSAIWVAIATEQYQSLPAEAQRHIAERIRQLLSEPMRDPGGYDSATDQWIADYGNGAGLIVYAVVPDRQRIIILRLAHFM